MMHGWLINGVLAAGTAWPGAAICVRLASPPVGRGEKWSGAYAADSGPCARIEYIGIGVAATLTTHFARLLAISICCLTNVSFRAASSPLALCRSSLWNTHSNRCRRRRRHRHCHRRCRRPALVLLVAHANDLCQFVVSHNSLRTKKRRSRELIDLITAKRSKWN